MSGQSVVTATVHDQVVAVADTKVTEPGDVAVYERGRSGSADGARTTRVDRAAQHVDADRVPVVAGQVQGVTSGAATQVERAARPERSWALRQFHQLGIRHIGGRECRLSPAAASTS